MADTPSRDRPGLSRRRWLIGALLGNLATRAAARGEEDEPAHERLAIEARAKKAGLPAFRATETEHYLGIGDAPDAYRDQALTICKALAAAYHRHFRDKGFPVELPRRRLTVVTLKDADSYKAFLGEDPGAVVGGHYELDTNRLVVFDFRPDTDALAASSERVNTFTLVHEATHQLTFNTGLLTLQADVPVCVSEGLAMYCELWRPGGRSAIGQVNRPRLGVFKGDDWIDLETLLADDAKLQDEAHAQLANAESWVLVHFLMRTPAQLPKFRAYLDAIRSRRDDSHRLDDARAHLGDLARLDRDLKGYATRLLRG